MKVEITWKKEMIFEGHCEQSSVFIKPSLPAMYKDAFNPFEFMLLALSGSAGISIVSYLSERRHMCDEFSISSSAVLKKQHETTVIDSAELIFKARCRFDPIQILNAVEVSQYRSSGISAMFSRIMSIRWVVIVNDKMLGEGIANFEQI